MVASAALATGHAGAVQGLFCGMLPFIGIIHKNRWEYA